ncbi:MAG: stalk domain-containing protein [Clostridia bacterium]|nr:stalk domain-containing protein [Clostridia bacterium]
MKKMLSILLAVCMMSSLIPVFAEESATAVPENTLSVTESTYGTPTPVIDAGYSQTPLPTELPTATPTATNIPSPSVTPTSVSTGIPDAEVEKLIQAEALEKLKAELDKIIEDLDKVKELTKDNFAETLKTLYKYVLKRDLYYKEVINVLRKLEKLENKELVKKAIIEFEKRYTLEMERDRKIHHRIQKVLQFMKTQKKLFKSSDKVIFNKILMPVVKKYYEQRKIIQYVQKAILRIKEQCMRAEVLQLIAKAREYQKAGDYEKAAELYQKAIETGLADKGTFKEAGQLLKKLEGKGPKIFVKGKRPKLDVKPVVINGRTLVPLRAIADALNASNVIWDSKTKTVLIVKGDKKIELVINSSVIKVNGIEIKIDVPAAVISGRTMVPARVVSETLDALVSYDKDTEVITIEDTFQNASQDIPAEAVREVGVTGADELNKVSEGEVLKELEKVNETSVEKSVSSVN